MNEPPKPSTDDTGGAGRTRFDLVMLYRLLRQVYWRLPVPVSWKRRAATLLFGRMPALREAGLLARANIDSDRTVELLSRQYESARHPAGLLAAPRDRLLVIEHRVPTPDRNSASVRMAAILEIVRGRGWEVAFASVTERAGYHWVLDNVERDLPVYERALETRGITVLFGAEAIARHLAAEGGSYRCAMLSYPEVMFDFAPLVRAFAPNATLVYDTVDLHGLRFSREAALGDTSAAAEARAEHYRRMEEANIDGADLVVAISPEEQDAIRRHNGAVPTVLVPNIHRADNDDANPEGRRGLLFVGHYLHAPNVDAVTYMAREIMPLVRKRAGDVDLYMVGSSMIGEVRALASRHVHAVGYVEDLSGWFDRARVFVAPLRFGAGMKGKVGQSLARGLPVVTTRIGAEGLGLEQGRHALIADDAEAFADAVARLLGEDELWRSLSQAGRDHVRSSFSPAAATPALEEMLAYRKPDGTDDWSRS